jgi:copper chaperone CopZ
VGKRALEGLEGIVEVRKGFHGFREINTVTYDPSVVTEAEMEAALKSAGTYLGTEGSP